jgi:chromosome partitioning protein
MPAMLMAMVNSKGGVGKSTLAVHFAVWLHECGYRVILLDCDLQRSSSQWIAEAEEGVRVEVYHSDSNSR